MSQQTDIVGKIEEIEPIIGGQLFQIKSNPIDNSDYIANTCVRKSYSTISCLRSGYREIVKKIEPEGMALGIEDDEDKMVMVSSSRLLVRPK